MSEQTDSLDELFQQLEARLAGNPALAGVQGICQFEIESGGDWWVEIGGESPGVSRGKSESPDVVVFVTAKDFADVFAGRADPVALFYQGALRARGNISLAMRVANAWLG